MNKVFIIFIVFLAALTRIAPHPPNFTPIISIALLSGLCFKNKISFLIPLLVMIFSDFLIGNFEMAIFVYPPLLLVFYLGKYLENEFTYKHVFFGSFIGSFLFFTISNFGVWLVGYPKSLSGFLSCYYMAIPFYKNTLISTILYSSILYFMYEILSRKFLSYQKK